MSFNALPEDINTLVHKVHTGEYQLPDFQRSYVWTRENVLALAATLIDGLPLGSIMTVDASPPMISTLAPREFTGAPPSAAAATPRGLVLDGQQRTTTIYHLLKGLPVPVAGQTSSGKPTGGTEHVYLFFDITAAAQGVPTEDALVITDHTRIWDKDADTSVDLSDPAEQQTHRLYPLFYGDKPHRWSAGLSATSAELDALDKISEVMSGYRVPVLVLDSGTSLVDIHRVYVSLNREGKRLDTIDLLAGIQSEQAAVNTSNGASPSPVVNIRHEYTNLAHTAGSQYAAFRPNSTGNTASLYPDSDAYLRAITLAVTWTRHQTDKDAEINQVPKFQLGVTYAEYLGVKDLIAEGYKWAGEEFLPNQGFVGRKNIPYAAVPTVLAALYAVLGGQVYRHDIHDRIAQWFWNALLTNLYAGGGTQNKVVKDFAVLAEWVKTGTTTVPPSFAETLTDEPLLAAKGRGNAMFKSVTALVRKRQPFDFLNAHAYNAASAYATDDHHIFPKAYAKTAGLDKDMFLCVVNQTVLNPRTNQVDVKDKAPSRYTAEIAATIGGVDKLRAVYAEHLIDYDAMDKDNFALFFERRLDAVCEAMETATGRPVERRLLDILRKRAAANTAVPVVSVPQNFAGSVPTPAKGALP